MDCLACHKAVNNNRWEHKPECINYIFDLVRPPQFDEYEESTSQLVGIPRWGDRKRALYKSELIEIAKDKGLNVKGLKKKELLELLEF